MKKTSRCAIMAALAAFMLCGTQSFAQTKKDSKPDAAASDKPLTAKDSTKSATSTEVPFEIKDWAAVKKACVENGGPINIDEYYGAINNVLQTDKTEFASTIKRLGNFMSCLQMRYTDELMCKADKVMTMPYFIKKSETTVENRISKEDREKIDKMIGDVEGESLRDALFAVSLRGDKAFLGQDVAAAICSILKEGTDCRSDFDKYFVAIEKGDSSMCDSISGGAVRDYCSLFTKMDAETICKSGSFKDTSYKKCEESLTAFKIFRKLPLKRSDEQQPLTEPYLNIAVGLSRDGNYCDTIYREEILPDFCRAKDLIAIKEYKDKEDAFRKQDAEKKKLLEEQDQKEAERVAAKRKAQAEEEAKKSEKANAEKEPSKKKNK